MKLPNFITSKFIGERQRFFSFFLLAFVCGYLFPAYSQKIAVIAPEENPSSGKTASRLREKLEAMDQDLVQAAVRSQTFENIYNLSTREAKNLGKVIGCDFFIIVKAENLRRTSFAKPLYFEAYAAIYLVSTRSGKLVFWTLKSFQGSNPEATDRELFSSLNQLAEELSGRLKEAQASETGFAAPNVEEIPEENSPAAQNFRFPLPFKRLTPVYTQPANLYGITATVDATVDLNEKGEVSRIEIDRWAGYELDESVKEVIRKMQWRPASRNGKAVPIRFLLRYNFKKVDKEEQ